MASPDDPDVGRDARPAPTRGGDDELLPEPPAGRPPGGIEGYRAGMRTRVIVIVGVLVVAAIAVWRVRDWQHQRELEKNAPVVPRYELSDDIDPATRPRQLVWSEGPARLGLFRDPPGVQEIVLPDRRLRLAPGYDQAQVKLEVKDGVTVTLEVLVGDVVELPLAAPRGSPPAPPAKAP